RSNLWLTIHVLTEVSSYAAFGLAWALGLIATVHYLTATYRRSPRFAELALVLVPGLLLATAGGAGVAASYGAFGPSWTTGDTLFYAFAVMGLVGEMLTLAAGLAIAGEVVNRLTLRDQAASQEVEEEGAAWATHEQEAGRRTLAASAVAEDG